MPNAFDDITAEQPTVQTSASGRNAFDDITPPAPTPAQLKVTAAGNIGGPGIDPSEGGGMLQLGPWDTGIHTPQVIDRLLAGTGRGMIHTGQSLANLVGLLPDSAMADLKKTDAPLMNTTAGQVGNLIGESAATAPLGMGAGAAVGRLAPALADSAIASGAVQGGVQGLATADPNEHGAQAIAGALTGGILGGATKLGGVAMRGLKRTDAAQSLIDQGVQLTPGQMNPGGAFNQFEQAAESIPGAKQIIDPARDAAERQYQALIIGKGAAPGAAPITPSDNIHDMLQQAYDSYAPLYDQAKGYPVSPVIMNTGQNVPLTVALKQASEAPGVPSSLKASENEWLQDRLTQLPQNPDSADLLDVRSDIRARGRTANLKTDTDSGHIATIAGRADDAITQSLQSQLPQAPLDALQAADSNYGNYKIIENAVAKSKDNLAGLTPQKLSQAVYDATQDANYARGGGGPLRDLAQSGTQVFQNVSPPTGARLLTMAAGVGGVLHPAVGIPAAATMLAGAGTQTGRRLAAGTTAPQQAAQRIAAALQSNVPDYARDIGSQYLTQASNAAALPYGQKLLPAAFAAALMAGQNVKNQLPGVETPAGAEH
jgi:hypothetical protein